jgi:hypothetical protein
MRRLPAALRALDPDQRLAAAAAAALLATMVLPWYTLQNVDPRTRAIQSNSVSAFGTFSFVEAAVLLVSAGVLWLLVARGQRRAFHLPGGDGTVIAAAGAWVAFLLFYRVLDRPDGGGYPVGVQWGVFVAFAVAAGLAVAGVRMRAARRPEPPNPAAEEDPAEWTVVAPRERRRAPGRRPVERVAFDDAPRPEDPPELRPRPRRP